MSSIGPHQFNLDRAYFLLGPQNFNQYRPQRLMQHYTLLISSFAISILRTINYLFGDGKWYNNQLGREIVLQYIDTANSATRLDRNVIDKIERLVDGLKLRHWHTNVSYAENLEITAQQQGVILSLPSSQYLQERITPFLQNLNPAPSVDPSHTQLNGERKGRMDHPILRTIFLTSYYSLESSSQEEQQHFAQVQVEQFIEQLKRDPLPLEILQRLEFEKKSVEIKEKLMELTHNPKRQLFYLEIVEGMIHEWIKSQYVSIQDILHSKVNPNESERVENLLKVFIPLGFAHPEYHVNSALNLLREYKTTLEMEIFNQKLIRSYLGSEAPSRHQFNPEFKEILNPEQLMRRAIDRAKKFKPTISHGLISEIKMKLNASLQPSKNYRTQLIKLAICDLLSQAKIDAEDCHQSIQLSEFVKVSSPISFIALGSNEKWCMDIHPDLFSLSDQFKCDAQLLFGLYQQFMSIHIPSKGQLSEMVKLAIYHGKRVTIKDIANQDHRDMLNKFFDELEKVASYLADEYSSYIDSSTTQEVETDIELINERSFKDYVQSSKNLEEYFLKAYYWKASEMAKNGLISPDDLFQEEFLGYLSSAVLFEILSTSICLDDFAIQLTPTLKIDFGMILQLDDALGNKDVRYLRPENPLCRTQFNSDPIYLKYIYDRVFDTPQSRQFIQKAILSEVEQPFLLPKMELEKQILALLVQNQSEFDLLYSAIVNKNDNDIKNCSDQCLELLITLIGDETLESLDDELQNNILNHLTKVREAQRSDPNFAATTIKGIEAKIASYKQQKVEYELLPLEVRLVTDKFKRNVNLVIMAMIQNFAIPYKLLSALAKKLKFSENGIDFQRIMMPKSSVQLGYIEPSIEKEVDLAFIPSTYHNFIAIKKRLDRPFPLNPNQKVTKRELLQNKERAILKQNRIIENRAECGNCGYRALSMQLFDTVINHDRGAWDLRGAAADYMLAHQDTYKHDMLSVIKERRPGRYNIKDSELEVELREHCKKVKNSLSLWISEREFDVISKIFGVRIEVYDLGQPIAIGSEDKDGYVMPNKVFGAEYLGAPVRLIIASNHFEPLVEL